MGEWISWTAAESQEALSWERGSRSCWFSHVDTSLPGINSQVPLIDQFGRLRLKVSQALLVRWLRTKKHAAERTLISKQRENDSRDAAVAK